MNMEPSQNQSQSTTSSSTTSTMQSLVGVYNFDSSENVDEYLKGLGVGLVLRKVQSVSRPNCIISRKPNSDQWTVVLESVFRKKEIVFKPQEKFEDETFDCRKCQSVVDIEEGGRLMKWFQTCEEGPAVEMVFGVDESGGMGISMKSGGHTCQLKFRQGRIEQEEQAPPPPVPVQAPAPPPAPEQEIL